MYEAFAIPDALEIWQAPGDMMAKVNNFDFSVGGGYEMSLFYPESEKEKAIGKEDRFTARFIELIPNKKLFRSDLPVNQILIDSKNEKRQ